MSRRFPRRRHRIQRQSASSPQQDRADKRPLRVQVMAYGPDGYAQGAESDPETLAAYPKQWPVSWINVEGLDDIEMVANIGKHFDLHPMSIEAILNTRERAKLEHYGQHHIVIARIVIMLEHLESKQVTFVLGDRLVLSFQEGEPSGDCFDTVRTRIINSIGPIRNRGADYLMYSLLDAIVDHYYPVLEDYGERMESLEDEILLQPNDDVIARMHMVKRDLLTMRRAIWPLREALSSLTREEIPLVTNDTRIYFRDCYEHSIGVIDLVETYRELGSDLTDVYLSSVSKRMNEVMKILTVITTIFMPPTLIAGIYGMNFDPKVSPWNLPELKWYYGYPYALLLMLILGMGLVILFRRMRWLSPPSACSNPAIPEPDRQPLSLAERGKPH